MRRDDKPNWHIFSFGTPCFVEAFDLHQNGNKDAQIGKRFKLPEFCSPIPLMDDFKEWDALSKRKFLALLKETGIGDRSLLLSGCVNYSQVLKNEDGIYEFVCSSLTNSIPSMIPNKFFQKVEYDAAVKETNVCNVNGYGFLEVDKDGWRFCVNDVDGNVHIPISKRF